MKLLTFLGLVLFTNLVKWTDATDEKDILKKVETGVTSGKWITGIFDSTVFGEEMNDLMKKVGPFLGAIGPALAIVQLFLPQDESAEMKLMRTEFSKIDNNFEKVMTGFTNLQKLLTSLEVNLQYSKYESNIRSMTWRLQDVINRKPSAIKIFKQNYRNYFGDSHIKLFLGLLNERSVFSKNIIEAAILATIADRAKISELMKNTFILILQGIKIELAYYKLSKGFHYDSLKDQWVIKLEKLCKFIAQKDDEVKNLYDKAYKEDFRRLVTNNYGKSNRDFAEVAFNHLSKKYYWRDWLVIVYDDITGSKNHYVQNCHGFEKLFLSGRNYQITSVDKSKPKPIWIVDGFIFFLAYRLFTLTNKMTDIADALMNGRLDDYKYVNDAKGAYLAEVPDFYQTPTNCKDNSTILQTPVESSGLIKTYANVIYACNTGVGSNVLIDDGSAWDGSIGRYKNTRLLVKKLPREQYFHVFA